MKKYLLSTFISTCFFLNANDAYQQEIEVVSLGSHCQASISLREIGLREFATPLDWLLSLDHKGLIRLLDDEFYHMFDAQYLIQYPEGYVINSRYNLDFRHDWSSHDLLGELPGIASKYERRIKRFFQLPEIAKRVVFIRTMYDPKLNAANNIPSYSTACTRINAQEAQELYACLKNKFPDLKFILAVFNFTDTTSGIRTDMHGIIEFQVTNLIEDSKQIISNLGDPAFFDKIYRESSVEIRR